MTKHIQHLSLQGKITEQHAETIEEYIVTVVKMEKMKTERIFLDALNEFANTPLDKRGTGWEWLLKGKKLIENDR